MRKCPMGVVPKPLLSTRLLYYFSLLVFTSFLSPSQLRQTLNPIPPKPHLRTGDKIMVFGPLRSIIRPVSRTLLSTRTFSAFPPAIPSSNLSPTPNLGGLLFCSFQRNTPWIPVSKAIHSLTDTRFPKRMPSDRSRRKRASLKPPGPYAWVKYVPGQPILPNQPNAGSVKQRNEKKRIRQRRAFILAEKKKRKALVQEANRKKRIQRIERKMAAVARDRAWAIRLQELQQLEEEKKKKSTMT